MCHCNFHLLSPCVKCYCWKRMGGGDNALHQWLGKKKSSYFFVEEHKKSWGVVGVWLKVDYFSAIKKDKKDFANLIVKVPHNRKIWRFSLFFFVFLKLSVGYVVLELCLVYNINIVFLKVSIKKKILKCWSVSSSLDPNVYLHLCMYVGTCKGNIMENEEWGNFGKN